MAEFVYSKFSSELPKKNAKNMCKTSSTVQPLNRYIVVLPFIYYLPFRLCMFFFLLFVNLSCTPNELNSG